MPQWPVQAGIDAVEMGPIGGRAMEIGPQESGEGGLVKRATPGDLPSAVKPTTLQLAAQKLAHDEKLCKGLLTLHQQHYQEQLARASPYYTDHQMSLRCGDLTSPAVEPVWIGDLEEFEPVKCSSPKRTFPPTSATKSIVAAAFRKTPGACRPKSAFSCLPTPSNSPVLNLFDLPNRFRGNGTPVSTVGSDVQQKQQTAVEVKVSNLDYNISGGEWKKILYSEFNQHIFILDIYIETQPDNTSMAFVVVPSIEQARFAISQFHRKKIGYKYIRVELVNPEADVQPADIRADVVAILKEVVGCSMPLFMFIELYEKRYHRRVSVSELYHMRDTVQIDEMTDGSRGRVLSLHHSLRGGAPGDANCRGGGAASSLNANALEWLPQVPECRTCPTHCETGSTQYMQAMSADGLPNVSVSLRTFGPQVHTILQSHNGCLPLLSFQSCYSHDFALLKPTFESGVSLEHLINCIHGVRIVMSRSGVKRVQWCENDTQWPQTTSSRSDGRGSNNPLLQQQINQFEREVMDVLKHASHTRMPFDHFKPAYHAHFGRQCRVADYGYTKLLDLLESTPFVTEILGDGSRKVVTLSHRVQMKRFTFDVLRMLKSQASKQINLTDFPHIYTRVLGRPFDIIDYGVCFIEDALNELEDAVLITVTGSGDDTVISIPKREQTAEEELRTQQFAVDVVDLLKQAPQCCISFHKFIPAYHHHFGRQCRVGDYGFTKLIELLEAVPRVMKIVDGPNEKWLYLTEVEVLKAVSDQITTLLQSCPGHGLPLIQLPAAFLRQYGYALQLSDYAVSGIVELVDRLPIISGIKMELQGDEPMIVVDKSLSSRRVPSGPSPQGTVPGGVMTVGLRVIWLLMERCDSGGMPASRLGSLYAQQFREQLDVAYVGKHLAGIVQVIGSDTTTTSVRLCAAQIFARDVRSLLACSPDGALAVDSVAETFSRHFGVSLVPAAYGCHDVNALLASACTHVLHLYAAGAGRKVALSYRFKSFLNSISSSDLEQPVTPDSVCTHARTPCNDSGIGESRDADSTTTQSRTASPNLCTASMPPQSAQKVTDLIDEKNAAETSALKFAARLLPAVPRAKCSPTKCMMTLEPNLRRTEN